MSKPRVLFIVLPYVVKDITASGSKIRSFLAFPYGLLSIATYCKELADIHIIDCDTMVFYRGAIEQEMRDFQPDIVGFSMMFDNSYRELGNLVGLVKLLDPNVLIVLGGAAASYSHEDILREQSVFGLDAICYSEGEIPFKNLLKIMAHGDPNSPSVREYLNDTLSWVTLESYYEPEVSYLPDLDTTIDIDYSFVNPAAYDMQEAFSPFADHHKKHNQFFIVTSRGCPFKCRFCSNAKIHGAAMRYASVDKIIAHVERLVKEHQMDVLTIYDDQLLLDKFRAKELFKRLIPFNLRIECPNGLSPAFIDVELAHYMRMAGMDTVYLAIEHGSEYILQEVIRKPLKLHMVKPVVDILREVGFFIHGFFVIGMPGERPEHRMETVKFIKEIGLDWAGLNPATPVRGSELYDECIKNGWIQKQHISDIIDKKYIINAPEIGLTPEIVEEDIDWMNKDVNFHNNYRMKVGDFEVAAACFREVMRRYADHGLAKYYLRICEERMQKK